MKLSLIPGQDRDHGTSVVGDIVNNINFPYVGCYLTAGEMACGQGATLDSAEYELMEGAGRRFRTKSGRASRRGPGGMREASSPPA